MRKQRERRPARLGAMEVERKISTVPSFVTLLHRFGFIGRDTKLSKHAGWSEFSKVEGDPVVCRIRERLKREGKLQQRAGLFSSVQEVQQVLLLMSADQLLRAKARYVLNDFRLTAEDKEQLK